jgi:hypothetical protein
MAKKSHAKMRSLRNNWLWLAAFILVTLIYHVCYGLQTIIPTNVSWLMTVMHDWGTHYLGFYFYKTEPWHFPLGAIHNYYAPVGTNVGFTDSIPLLAIFFKLLAPVLPEDFQYFGIWLYACHLLAAFFTVKLLNLFNVNRIIILLAVIFIAANPVLVYRGLHPALCAHWLFIASLYLYFQPDRSARQIKNILSWQLILLAISALINPYICFTMLGFSFIFPLKLAFFDKTMKKKWSIIYFIASIVTLVILFYVVGMIDFGAKEDLGVQGAYGLYSLNLNCLYNSWGFGTLLTGRRTVSWHQYEGFMYLGLGGIIVFLLALILVLVKKLRGFSYWQSRFTIRGTSMWPLFILCVLLTLFAITHIISLDDKVLFTIPLPKQIIKLGDIFRASARFFWIPYYMIMLFSIIILAKTRINRYLVIAVLGLALLVQLYDTKRLLTFRDLTYGSYTPPISTHWNRLISSFDTVVLYPPFLATYKSDLDYQFFSFIAAKERKPIDIGYVARANSTAVNKVSDSLNKALSEGIISPRVLYITTKAFLPYFTNTLAVDALQLNALDGYYYLYAKEGAGKDLLQLSVTLNQQNKASLDSGIAFVGEKLYYEEGQRITPAEKGKVLFNIEKVQEAKNYVSLDGWAFIAGTSDSRGDSIFSTLENPSHFYISKTKMKARPDLTAHYKTQLDDAGFYSVIFKDHVEKGKYQVGILIKDKKGNFYYQPSGKMIKNGMAEFVTAEKISALPPAGPIIYGIDLLESTGGFLNISGWATLENADATNNVISVVLKNGDQSYIAEAEPSLRPDVSARPGNKYNLDNSGFAAKVLKQNLPKGTYQIGILIKNSKTKKEGFLMTNRQVNVQ